jgi:exopolysaccharide biosynthesis protein
VVPVSTPQGPVVPRVAIGGNLRLVMDGNVVVQDDGQMHPRTAVGVDRDTGTVLLVVVDGRQSSSRGYTLLELAQLMAELGAEGALNLDGGGSATMAALDEGGAMAVQNSPSDGQQRGVPNGLAVTYDGGTG